jgi:hypothetical protein
MDTVTVTVTAVVMDPVTAVVTVAVGHPSCLGHLLHGARRVRESRPDGLGEPAPPLDRVAFGVNVDYAKPL